jgi:hypothetical protein
MDSVSKVMSKSASDHTGKLEDWNADRRSVKSVAPETTTPDEVR